MLRWSGTLVWSSQNEINFTSSIKIIIYTCTTITLPRLSSTQWYVAEEYNEANDALPLLCTRNHLETTGIYGRESSVFRLLRQELAHSSSFDIKKAMSGFSDKNRSKGDSAFASLVCDARPRSRSRGLTNRIWLSAFLMVNTHRSVILNKWWYHDGALINAPTWQIWWRCAKAWRFYPWTV
jgi:hypothetical protein